MSIKGMSDNDLACKAVRELRKQLAAGQELDIQQASDQFISKKNLSDDPSMVGRVKLAFTQAFEALQLENLHREPLRLFEHPNLSPHLSARLSTILTELHGPTEKVAQFLLQYFEELDYEVDESNIVQQSQIYKTLPDRLQQAAVAWKKTANDSKVKEISLLACNFLRQKRDDPLNLDKDFKEFLEILELSDEAATRAGFKIGFKYHLIMKVLQDPFAHASLFLSPKEIVIAQKFPNFYREYIHSFEAMAGSTLSSTDFAGHLKLFRDFAIRLKRDLHILDDAMQYFDRDISPSNYQFAYALMENLIQNPEDFDQTNLYRHLRHMDFNTEAIDRILKVAERDLPSPSSNPTSRRLQAALFLAARISTLEDRKKYDCDLFQSFKSEPILRVTDRELANSAFAFLTMKDKSGSTLDESRAYIKANGLKVKKGGEQFNRIVRAIGKAQEAIHFQNAWDAVQHESPEIRMPSDSKSKQFFEVYPQFGHRYFLQAKLDHQKTHSSLDANALQDAWLAMTERFDLEVPALYEGITYLRTESSMSPREFKLGYYLHCVKYDPRIKGLSTSDTWDFLKDHYPYLASIIPKEVFLKQSAESGNWFQDLISCLPAAQQSLTHFNLVNFEFIEEIARTPADRLSGTSFYEYLSIGLEFSEIQIQTFLQRAEVHLSNPSANPVERRKQAMLYLVSQVAKQQREYQKLFGGTDLRLLNQVSRDFIGMGPEAFEKAMDLRSFPLSPQAQTFINFGSLIPTLQSIETLHNEGTPILLAMLRARYPAFARLSPEQIDAWKCQASMAFEAVVANMVQNKNPNHPLSIHQEITELAKERVQLDVPQGKKWVTSQFETDCDRYDQLILAHGNAATVEFPGEYGNGGKAQTKGALIAGLEDLTKGEDPELLFLLQEMAGGQNSYGRFVDLWIQSDLAQLTGDSKIGGFIMLIPRNTTRVIKKENEDLFTAEYDFELITNNQHMMERMDLAPPGYQIQKTHKFRLKYEIKRYESGAWILQQPTWIPLAPAAPNLTQIYKPIPLPRQDMPQPAKVPIAVEASPPMNQTGISFDAL